MIFFIFIALVGVALYAVLLRQEVVQLRTTVRCLRKRKVKASAVLVTALEDAMVHALQDNDLEKYAKIRNLYVDIVPIDD